MRDKRGETEGWVRWSRRAALGLLGVGGALTIAVTAGRALNAKPSSAPQPDPHYPGDDAVGPMTGPKHPSGSTAVARENSRPGTEDFSLSAHRFSDDERAQITGYVSATSVAPGDVLDFRVSVAPAQDYRVQIYRVGDYDRSGGRLVRTSPWLPGRTQPAPTVERGSRMVRCDWPVGWRLPIGPDWVSGYYLALLTNSEGWSHWVPFVVREPQRPADGLVVVPTSTYQAYNLWPYDGRTGASLYYGFDPSGKALPAHRATAVSHDRPYGATGLPFLSDRDIGFVQWVERHAEVSYASSEDLDSGRVDPRRYRAVFFCGHDEYWTVAMRKRAEAARDSGTSLIFLSANNCYWRIRYGTSEQPDERIVTCSKEMPPAGEAIPLTTMWRHAGSPEQPMIGAQYVSVVDGHVDLVVQDSSHWFWAGTGLSDGDRIPRAVWGEADQVMSNVSVHWPDEHRTLASSPYRRKGKSHRADTTLYRAPSGAWVFAAGSMGWTAALHGEDADERLQRAMRNLLDRVLTPATDDRPSNVRTRAIRP